MSKMHIKRSIVIESDSNSIYKILNNFNQWKIWSPWLIMDPDAEVTVADDAKSYKWEGTRVGSGNMKVLSEVANKSIDYDLNFLKPWKSNAKVRFELEEEGSTTKVSWLMDSKMPFFMFFMKKMMEAYVGADYERGLDMLKAYIENGEISSKLNFAGEKTFNGCDYFGIKTNVEMDRMGSKMEEDFGKLRKYSEDHKLEISDAPFTIYHKWDIVKGNVSYTTAMPVKELPDDLPAELVTGKIPATQVYSLEHKGAYEHLGNAWSTLYSMQRGKEFKHKKKIDPFERYLNNPAEVSKKELITQVNIPVK